MIFIDADFAPMFKISGCKVIDGLTKASGANIVVSKKMYPPVGELLKKHAEEGSVFILIDDFVIKDEFKLSTNAYKVIELGAKVKSFIVEGIITKDYDTGNAIQDGLTIDCHYSDYVKYSTKLMAMGFSVVNIEREHIGQFITEIDSSIGGFVEFMPSALTEFVPILDWRATLSAIPSVGPEYAQRLYDDYKSKQEELPPLLDVIYRLTDYSYNTSPIEKMICAGTRAWFGIPDGLVLSLDVPDERSSV